MMCPSRDRTGHRQTSRSSREVVSAFWGSETQAFLDQDHSDFSSHHGWFAEEDEFFCENASRRTGGLHALIFQGEYILLHALKCIRERWDDLLGTYDQNKIGGCKSDVRQLAARCGCYDELTGLCEGMYGA